MTVRWNRRHILMRAASLAAAAMVPNILQAASREQVQFVDHPFKLGVASGDPLADGFVIWTRLAPIPFDPLATPQVPIAVNWQVAEDRKFKRIVTSGTAIAYPQNVHAVHVEVMGLKASREYFYRFHVGKEESQVGRAVTLPFVGVQTDDFRFAFVSCQNIADGQYAAYRDLVSQAPSLVIHTGDYIYESVSVGGVRRIPVREAVELDGYRNLYARYKLDPALQAAHAVAPWLSIWDDHEVENNWGGDFSGTGLDEEDFLRRKTAAFKAYYEHMPLRLSSRPDPGGMKLYQRSVVGDLIQFDLLDCRQYRDDPACQNQPRLFRKFPDICDEARSEDRSMLGRTQEKWLRRGFGHYGAKWNVLVQTTMMAPFDSLNGKQKAYDMDGWDGFSATRQRIMDMIVRKAPSNPITIGGNIHAYYAGVIHRYPEDKASEALLTEIIGTSISSRGGNHYRYEHTIGQFKENSFAQYFENRHRGYVLCDVTKKSWTNTLRVVDSVFDPNSSSSTLRKLVIEDGKVGVLSQ